EPARAIGERREDDARSARRGGGEAGADFGGGADCGSRGEDDGVLSAQAGGVGGCAAARLRYTRRPCERNLADVRCSVVPQAVAVDAEGLREGRPEMARAAPWQC